MEPFSIMNIKIYYDGQCPFCSNYVRLVDLREAANDVALVDLRQDVGIRSALIDAGYDLDGGMVVDVDGELYHGKEAAQVLSRLSGRGSFFLKANHFLFKSEVLSTPLYSLMRIGRDATLFILGRSRIKEDSEYRGIINIFSFFFGVFCFLHFLVYAYHFRLPLYPTTYLVPVLGVGLILKPESRRLLAIVLLTLFVDGVLQAPVFSNHTILKNSLVVTMLLAGVYSWLRGGGEAKFYSSFAAVGRGLLLTMYFFGVFHKINHGFLDPSVSCAVALWREMPAYLPSFEGDVFAYIKSYGTLVIETLIFIFLLSRRFRSAGIAFGIAFHSILALSGYSLYAPFSMLTVVLHTLFLSPHHANEVLSSRSWVRMRSSLKLVRMRVALVVYLVVVWGLAYFGQYSSVGLLWIVAMLTPYYAIFSLHRHDDEWSVKDIFIARPLLFNLISLAFIVNCFSPYLGLKTSQSMNMFANLRLEGGVSNHYIMGVPGPFDYLDELVRIEQPGGDRILSYIHDEGLWLVHYEFISYLERNRDLKVVYSLDGERHSIEGYDDIPAKDRAMLHPRWVRAWLHFIPVDLNSPKGCALDR